MTQDRQLIDTIKINFARKSSAQLQDIQRSNDPARWSLEAMTAAKEVLEDRLAGRAQEPQAPEEEPPPPDPNDFGVLALGVLVGALTGNFIIPPSRAHQPRRVDPDSPAPFGPRMAWLALDTTDTQEVVAALGLHDARTTTWQEGLTRAHETAVFVTPPLGDWTLAVGAVLFPSDRVDTFVKPLLERLSRQFGDAQYFCTHQDIELHVWARARKGQLVRGCGWLGEKAVTLWNEGGQTREERALEFPVFEERSSESEQAQVKQGSPPDEEGVMQLASLWSIDPTTLDEHLKEPGQGVLGSAPWRQRRTDST
jgi:hypothetical protein